MIYGQIFWLFWRVSLISFGGVFAVLPEVRRVVVDEHHWLSSQEFVQSFVVGQFVPGPNMAMCPLIGYRVAGFWGAVVAGLGIYLGPVLVIAVASTVYYRHRGKSWVRRLEIALRPVVLGLVSASSYLFLSQQLGEQWIAGLVLGVPVAILNWHKKLGAMSAVFVTGALWWVYTQHMVAAL